MDQPAADAPTETPVETPVDTPVDTPVEVAPVEPVVVVVKEEISHRFLEEIRHELTAFEHEMMARVFGILSRIKPHHREKLFEHFKKHR